MATNQRKRRKEAMENRKEGQEYITTDEAADLLHHDPRNIRYLLTKKQMRGSNPTGRKWLIPRAEIDRLLGKPPDISQGMVEDQIRQALQGHWEDLQAEAARWRDQIWAPQLDGLRFDVLSLLEPPYLLADEGKQTFLSEGGDGTFLFQCLLRHLEKDGSKAFDGFKKWQGETAEVLQKVGAAQQLWWRVTETYLEREKVRRGIAQPNSNVIMERPPGTNPEFALGLWDAVVRTLADNELGQMEFELDGPPDVKPGDVPGAYILRYAGTTIAGGTNIKWMEHLRDLHGKLYAAGLKSLAGRLVRRGVLNRIEAIHTLADAAMLELDIVSHGGIKFTPNTCDVCVRLLEPSEGSR